MRLFLPTFLIIILALAIYPFIGQDDKPAPAVTGLPWQIEVLPDGHTKVFGLVPGQSHLQDALTALGNDYQLAIVESESSISLEMYFENYRAGLMTAKLVLVADTDEALLREWQQRAIKADYMGSGQAKKYLLAEADRLAAMQTVLRAIACIPAVNLDADIIHKRFGEPAGVVADKAGVEHYLYPAKGLVISASDSAKEVLQYVAPRAFASLSAPLQSDADSSPNPDPGS